jgi:hypothetical protein
MENQDIKLSILLLARQNRPLHRAQTTVIDKMIYFAGTKCSF